jgi:quercetin dioxygenase-like cupin family protein
MTGKFSYSLKEAHGFQHCHGEECDDIYFRPLVVGKEMYTYVATIPPGGGVHGHAEPVEFEQSIFVLSGTVTATLGFGLPHEVETKQTVGTYEAFVCPAGELWGKWNLGDTPAIYLCTHSPAPKASGPEEACEIMRSRGVHIYSPEELNEIAGDFLRD